MTDLDPRVEAFQKGWHSVPAGEPGARTTAGLAAVDAYDATQYSFRLTNPIGDAAPNLEAGAPLADYPPSGYMPAVGKKLIQIGTFLQRAVAEDDEDDWNEE